METIKTLLTENKQIPKYLHDTQGFDFQKPVTIVKGEGKFTLNSLKALLATEGIDLTDDYKTMLLLKASSDFGVYNYCYAVLIESGKFITDIPCHSYEYHLDTFYTKGSFEEVRKNKCEYYYLVVQATADICEIKERKPDLYQRLIYIPTSYEKCGDGKGSTWIYRIELKERDYNTEKFEHRIDTYNAAKTNNILDIIDKSGYLVDVRHRDLYWLAQSYKAKKRKAEFLATDYTDAVCELGKELSELKKELIGELSSVESADGVREVVMALYKYSYALKDFAEYKDKINKREYESNQRAEYTAKNVRLNIEAARKIIFNMKNKEEN